MNTAVMMTYLSQLSQNNNREWYHAHKSDYMEANAAFEALLQSLINRIGETDSSILQCNPHELTFKLVRDTRFSHDKSPYNPAFRAHISAKGKLPIPVGYYLMIKPGNESFLGGGLFADLFKDATSMVRDYIAANPHEWDSILHAQEFQKHFTVQGTALKNVPTGYDKEHPQAAFLKYKSWYLEYKVSDEVLENTEEFLNLATIVFQHMKPFNDYLNKALVNFEMPER